MKLKHSLLKKLLLLIFFVLILPICVVSYININQTKQIYIDTLLKDAKKQEMEVSKGVENLCCEFDNVASLIKTNSNFYAMQTDSSLSIFEKYILRADFIYDISSTISVLTSETMYISVVDSNHFYTNYHTVSGNTLIDKLNDTSQLYVTQPGELTNAFYDQSYYIPNHSVPLFTYVSSYHEQGKNDDIKIIISAEMNSISNILSSQLNNGVVTYILVDDQNKIVDSNVPDVTYDDFQESFASAKYTSTCTFPRVPNLTLYSIISDKYIIDSLNKVLKNWIIFEFVIIAAFILVFLFFFLRYFVAPLRKLSNTMLHAKENNLDVSLHLHGDDEITSLSRSFNTMQSEIKGLMKELQIKEKEKSKSYLLALQNQIRPHFLFNSLNAIKWKAYNESQNEIGNLIADFSSLYEFMLNRDSEFVEIRYEVEFLTKYVSFLSFRYMQDIKLEIKVDECLIDKSILKFTLQPIIENSILHGFSENTENAKITLNIHQDGSHIKVEVSDNGTGMTQEVLDHLFDKDKPQPSIQLNGIGMNNIMEKLKLYYGTDFTFQIESNLGEGTTVTLSYPLDQ